MDHKMMEHKLKISLQIGFAAMLTMTGGLLTAAARANSPLPQNAVQNNAIQNNAAPTGTLQITGTATRFSIAANRADVQETLKTVFDQAAKQFVLENNVAGQITLRLTDQPLNVTLDAICKQAFLRYRADANTGITTFDRDDEALRNAFTRLRSLDASLRDQVRALGLSLPSESVFGAGQSMGGGYRNTPGGAAGGNFSENGSGLRGKMDSALSAVRRAEAPRNGRASDSTKDAAKPAAPQGVQIAPQGPTDGQMAAGDAALDQAVPTNPADLQVFLQANNFVSFHVPADKPEPVYSVLEDMGRQARVNLLIDPDVPSGSKFTLRGSLSPRPLTEALNILTPYARLEWRWVGSSIFVQTAPDFAIFFGEEKEPRASYTQKAAPRKQETPALKKAETKEAPVKK